MAEEKEKVAEPGNNSDWGILSHTYDGAEAHNGIQSKKKPRSTRESQGSGTRGRGGKQRTEAAAQKRPNRSRRRDEPTQHHQPQDQFGNEPLHDDQGTRYYSANAEKCSVTSQVSGKDSQRAKPSDRFKEESDSKRPHQERNKSLNSRQKQTQSSRSNGRDKQRSQEPSDKNVSETDFKQSQRQRSTLPKSSSRSIAIASHQSNGSEDNKQTSNNSNASGYSYRQSKQQEPVEDVSEQKAERGRIIDGKYVGSSNESQRGPRADSQEHLNMDPRTDSREHDNRDLRTDSKRGQRMDSREHLNMDPRTDFREQDNRDLRTDSKRGQRTDSREHLNMDPRTEFGEPKNRGPRMGFREQDNRAPRADFREHRAQRADFREHRAQRADFREQDNRAPRADFKQQDSYGNSDNRDWRSNTNDRENRSFNSRSTKPVSSRHVKRSSPIDSEQARTLIEQLFEESYECMVCCERIRSSQSIWSCQNCYHLFHLKCIMQWAVSGSASLNADTNGWRCPGCQNVTSKLPSKYNCFCGSVTDPNWNPRHGITPHSCGELCQKQRNTLSCSHTCNELCHPGPCPSCPVMVAKECPCGKTKSKMRCGNTKIVKCTLICDKVLKCKQHNCKQLCHEGPCDDCELIQVQKCYCGQETRSRNCGDGLAETSLDNDGTPRYSCEKTCSLLLDCGNHNCNEICHPGDCGSCSYLPENVKYCPCKQTLVANLLSAGVERQSCLDPIPCCNNFCGKKLLCGPKGQSHFCKCSCHTGECGPCDGTTLVSCRCGKTETEILCKDYNHDKESMCERRCNKKRKCGRHRCNQKCCVDLHHNCNLICGRKLGCGLHKCDELCHTGNCPRCWQTSFDERLCYCGETVQYPPIPCGTPLPECKNRCMRPHPCKHEPQHNCHSEDNCPPCVVLVEKLCLCKQETRKNVPCHLNVVSCGKPCGKDLPCGQHKCLKICHMGECLEQDGNCQQPCTVSRRDCPHPCSTPCHSGQECPEGPCRSQITIRCKCARKSEKVLCLAGNSKVQFQRFATDSMGDKLRNLRSGQSVDISGLMIAEKRGGLECDEDCAVVERNKRLAEALGIENPDGNHFHYLPFSFFLKEEAKKQLPLVKTVEEAIEVLLQKIKKSSLVQITHSFPPMNSTQRKLVHELADYYNCKTVSYDQEPKRNTVVTATRDSFLVNVKLSTTVERKLNKPLPNPVLSMQEKPLTFQRMQKKTSHDDLTAAARAPSVDYFEDDFPE